MKQTFGLVLPLFLTLTLPLWGYDEVHLEKVLSLVDKKTQPEILRKDNSGNLWILNKTHGNLQLLSLEGRATLALNPGKKADDLFKSPADFGFFKNGSLIVADNGLNRAAIISSESGNWKDAKLVAQFPLNKPQCMAVSRDNVIAVGFDGQSSIAIYSTDGVLLHRLFAGEEKVIKSIRSLAFAPDGTLWALDGAEDRLHRFSSLRKWLGAVEGLNGAHSVAVNDYGTGYVSLQKGQWQEINKEGQLTGGFGTKGKNPGQLDSPTGIIVAGSNILWLADAGNKRLQSFRVEDKTQTVKLMAGPAAYLQVRLDSIWQERVAGGAFTADGKLLLLNSDKNGFEWVNEQGETTAKWEKAGKATAYKKPQDVTVDGQQRIWVTDAGDDAIKNLSDAGALVKSIGNKGKNEGSLNDPSFVRIRSDGSFVVVDKDNSRIQVLGPQGLFLFAVGSQGKKEGQFITVSGLAINNDKIAILDRERKALKFYSSGGKFQMELANKEGKAPYWDDPVSLASDANGRFYVLDNGSKRVRVFDSSGQFMADFTAEGDRLVCGGNHKVLVISKQDVRTYAVHFVPRELKNVLAVDEGGIIKLTWDASSEAVAYNIYRSTSPNVFSFLAKVEGTSYNDNRVIPSLPTTYAISGVNDKDDEGVFTPSNTVKPSRRRDVSLVTIEKIALHPVFTAAFKYYAGKPIGEIEIQNNDDLPHRNVKISLSLKDYGDFATEMVVPELAAGERRMVPVTMTFNDSVLELTEDTPVQMDVRVSYFEDNEEKSVNQNAPVTLFSRNAIAWSDKARIASFVTPRDVPIVEFARAGIRAFLPQLKSSTVGKPLAKMMLFYESINALGISYVPDPKTPFVEVSGHPEMIDYVQFPRETLRRKTGDCDDTTALLASLLESIGVQTALVDTPGHIFLMANLEEDDLDIIGFPEERLVEYKGSYWVPIETTQLGKNFNAAWQAAAAKIKAAQQKGLIEFIPVSQAHETYAPVTLVEVDEGTPAYPEEKARAAFPPLLEQLQKDRYEARLNKIQSLMKDNPADSLLAVQLGMIHVEGGKTAEGQALFKTLVAEGQAVEVQAAAANNLGNIAYLEGKYQEALENYQKAARLAPEDGGILINNARAAWKLGNNDDSKKILAGVPEKLKGWQEFVSDIPVEFHPK